MISNIKSDSIECEVGGVYKLRSRNLDLGVYCQDGTFIGIREKFNSLFLFPELHRNRGGTALPLEYLCKVPNDIPLVVSLGTADEITGKNVRFDRPIADGGIGWYYVDTGLADDNIRPVERTNKRLFQFLLQQRVDHGRV